MCSRVCCSVSVLYLPTQRGGSGIGAWADTQGHQPGREGWVRPWLSLQGGELRGLRSKCDGQRRFPPAWAPGTGRKWQKHTLLLFDSICPCFPLRKMDCIFPLLFPPKLPLPSEKSSQHRPLGLALSPVTWLLSPVLSAGTVAVPRPPD